MMDATRRNILKLFGVTAAATTATLALPPSCTVPEGEVTVLSPSAPLGQAFPTPVGMTYNWKRVFIDKETPDFDYIGGMVVQGWKPVPRARHRDVFPDDGSYWIEFGGLVLMEKPTADLEPPRPSPMLFET